MLALSLHAMRGHPPKFCIQSLKLLCVPSTPCMACFKTTCTAHVHSSIALLLGADTFYAAQTSSTKYKRMSAGCAVAGGCIYIAGGHNLDHYLNSIERYDPRTPKWKLVRSHATQHAGGTQH